VTITPAATNAATPITIAYDGSLAVAPQITFTAKEGATTLATYVMNTTGYYTELTVPTALSNPIGIAPGSDGGMWFTEFNASKIGHVVSPLSATSTLLDYPTQFPSESPLRIAAAPSGINYMFYTDPANFNYGRVNTTAVPNPQESGGPAFTGVTAVGTSMFLSVPSPSPIVKIDPTTQATLGNLGITGCDPTELAGGSDGNLWVACSNTNLIAAVNPTTFSSYTTVTLPAGAVPIAIINGPDNAMWLCDSGRNDIVRVSLAGGNAVSSYATTSGCYGITVGHDGAIWYTNFSPSLVGRVDVTSGQVVEFSVPGGGARGIATGSDGWLWFTESSGNKIGRMQTAL
jgi:virginiamycin B lyase